MTDVLSDVHSLMDVAAMAARKGDTSTALVFLYNAAKLAEKGGLIDLAKQIDELINLYISLSPMIERSR